MARNAEIFGRQIGISTDEMEFIQARSPFLPPMRQVIFSPVVKLNYKSTEEDYNKLFTAINNILDKHEGQSGIIHCVSYKLRDRILAGIALRHQQRVITHGKEYMPREDAIAKFKCTRGAILVSPSAEVGLDFPDDEARWCIWAKIPFADLRDKQVKARQEIDPEWYVYCSVMCLIQGAGRIVRHEQDWGITYVLDLNMRWMLKHNRHLFPDWFMDAVHYRTMDQIMGNKGSGEKKVVTVNKQDKESSRLGRDRNLFPSSVLI